MTDTSGSGRSAIALCFAIAMIEGYDLQAAGVAAPQLVPAFGLSSGQAGLFFSAATFGLIIGALAGGRIADRHGRKIGLLLAIVMFGIFSILTGFAWDFPTLLGARFLTGVGLGGALPNLIAIAAESSREGRTSSAVAAMYAGIPLGGAFAALTSMLDLHGGWSTIFIIGGVLPLLVAPILLRFVPPLRPPASPHAAGSLAAIFGRGRWSSTVLLWVGFFFSLLVLYLLLNWLPVLLVGRGMGRTEAGGIQIAFNLAGAACSLLTGRAMDRLDRRMVVALSFGALIASLIGLAVAPATFGFSLLAGAVVGGAIVAVQSILYGLAPDQYPAEVRGTGVGSAVAVGRLGSVAGPLFAASLISAGGSSTDVLAGIIPVAALGGAATLALVWKRPRPRA